MPYLIAIFAVLFVISFLFSKAERPKIVVESNRMQELPATTISKIVGETCLRAKTTDRGCGINPTALMPVIRAANKAIDKKIKTDEPLSEAEKWFYENYYLLHRYVYMQKSDMKDLPHINGKPRIVAVAKCIVNNSLENLDGQKVKTVIFALQDRVALTYPELKQLHNAIFYALVEQAYILAKRILHKQKMLSVSNKYNVKYLDSDSYLYYLTQNKDIFEKHKVYLVRKGLSEAIIVANFNMSVMLDTEMAKTIFCGFRETESYVSLDNIIKMSSAYRVISSAYDISDVSTDTLEAYFTAIARISDKMKVAEGYVAEIVSNLAKKNDCDPSVVIFDHHKEIKKSIKGKDISTFAPYKTTGLQRLYIATMLLFSLAGSFCIGWFVNIPLGIISWVPLLFVAENITNYLLNGVVRDKNPLKLRNKNVPFDSRVAVIISQYVDSIENYRESLNNLRQMRASNGGDNIEFCLLLDTKGGDTPITELDRALITDIKSQGLENDIVVFMRKKALKNGKYIAKERKRGAINAVNKLFVTGNRDEFLFVSNENYFIPKYAVTLDEDNSLFTGDVTEMVNIISHPYNKKYDLMTLHSRYDLYSIKTLYSKRFLGESGAEEYPVYSDLFYRAFGLDLYCGKSIYRVDSFYRKLDEIFPSERILSHDIIEGAVLTTGGGTTVLEEAPSDFIGDRQRKKRWLRGDIQLLPFIYGRWKNDEKQTYKTNIEPLYKFVMWRNILDGTKAAFLAAGIILGFFVGKTALLTAVGLFVAPYILDIIKCVRNISAGVSLRYVAIDIKDKFVRMLEDAFMLWYYAFDNTVVFLSTIFAMATKKNLLNWKTYKSSCKKPEARIYAKEFAPSFCALTIFSLAIIFFDAAGVFFGIYLLAEFCAFIEVYACSATPLRDKKISDEEKQFLAKTAEKTYKYFTYMWSYDQLIADNLQIKPYKGVSKTTSPTNIGFGLLAAISACSLKIIDQKECVDRLEKSLAIIDKLPKWRGNLYNWYDVVSKKPVNSFVSSVDSGNFLACLIVCREYFRRIGDDINELKTDLLIINTDLESLYDKDRRQFFIGYDGEKYVGHYDVFNSESRLLTTVFMAYYKNKDNFRCLSRDMSRYRGNTYLSWSGTAFETLMPALFLPVPAFSGMYCTEKNVCAAQKDTAFDGIWGIGESGYYAFDEQLRYQYYAFGIKKLSLKNGKTIPVISPYSSAICLKYYPKQTIKNLQKLEQIGMSDEYGFFEAYDKSRGEKVRSHMTHHQGMTLCAIANMLENKVINALFLSDEKIAAAIKNYNELLPKINNPKYLSQNKQKIRNNPDEIYEKVDNIEHTRRLFGLQDGEYRVFVNAYGGGYSACADIMCGKFFGVYEETHGSFFMVRNADGKLFSPTYLPFADDCNYNIVYNGNEIILENSTKKLVEKVSVINGLNGEVRYFSCKENNSKIAFFSSVSLNTFDAYNSHPAYNNLFVEAKKIGEDTIVLKNRPRDKNGEEYLIGVKVSGVTDLRFECNLQNFIGRNGNLSKPIIFDNKKVSPSLGDVLNPCIGFSGNLAEGECSVAILFGKNEKELIETLELLPHKAYSYALTSGSKRKIFVETCDVMCELLYRPYAPNVLNSVLKRGKSLDFINKCHGRKILLYKFDKKSKRNVEKFLLLSEQLVLSGFNAKSYIEVVDRDDYESVAFLRQKCDFYKTAAAEICYSDENIGEYAFLTINSDCVFPKPRYIKNKKFELMKREEENYFDDELKHGALLYRSGNGGFDENDDYLAEGNTLLPYTDVIAGENGGMLLTDNGGGFFYFGNSRENKMIRFDNDPIIDDFSEFLYVKTSSGCHRLNSGCGKNRFSAFGRGKAVFVSKINRITCTVKYGVICGGKGRIITVDAVNHGGYAEFVYGLEPALGWLRKADFLSSYGYNNCLTVTDVLKGNKLYVKMLAKNPQDIVINDESAIPYFEYLTTSEEIKLFFVFSQDESLIRTINEHNLSFYEEREAAYFASFDSVEIATPYRAFNAMLKWLPYQIMSSRINAKAGFYQVGGATGFRDCLQDGLAVMHFLPEKTKEIILEAAKRQYKEGDVMHWWHQPKLGLRSKISDDKLFLPLAVAEYVEFSGDYAILDIELPYLQSPLLGADEKTRYENPRWTQETESLRKHCLKAIKSSLRYGEHGLLVMGGGDWNDGMDEICSSGRGESLFTSMLAYEVLIKLSKYFDDDKKKDMLRIAEEIKTAINTFGYDKDRYMRLYSDDGKWYGCESNDILKLDLLTQSYAVISGVADEVRGNTVLDTAKELVDTDAGIIKLLSPPLRPDSGFGYISAYPAGVRENGGQYTHAAVWYLIALTRMGRQDEAYELFMMINPAEKARDKEKYERYRGEPYVFAGDVYSNRQNYGRMGWSWYTGSAAWAYRLVVEEFFGLKRRGNKLYICPHLPKKLLSSVVSYRYDGGVFSIEYRTDESFSVELNGETLAENYVALDEGALQKIVVSVP